VFQFGSVGCPEAVWSFLTTPESTRRFLFGLSLESSWVLGAPVTGRFDRATVLPGRPADVWPWLVQLGKERGWWYLPA